MTGLEPDGAYYVTVRVLIRPVTDEDLGEIEDWLSARSRIPKGRRGDCRAISLE